MTVIDDRLASFRAKVDASALDIGHDVAWYSCAEWVLAEFDKAVKLMEEDRLARMKVTMKAYEKALKRAKKSDDATRRVAGDGGLM